MRLLNIFLALTTLATIVSCSKDNPIPGQGNMDCGTIADMTWTQNVKTNDLAGNWKIWNVSYSAGAGQIHTFDTTYALNAPLTLNANGTGTLYNSIQLNWTLTIGQHLPKLMLTNIDTLFPFQVNFINIDTAILHLQIRADPGFFATCEQGSNGQWERTYIRFEKQ